MVLTLAVAPRAQAFVYWANPGSTEGSTGTIGRANLDGTGVDRSFITNAGSQYGPAGVAVDEEHIYWSDDRVGARTIGRANLDGTGVDRSFITVSTNTAGGPCGVGVAVDAAHIYWADGCGGLAQCCIGRANLDGTGVDRSFIDAGAGSAVAVDAGHIYWTTIFAIGRANLDGSGADPGFITLRDFPAGVAVDSGRIYWTLSSNLTSHFDPVIGRANLDGTGVDQSFITDTGPTVAGVAVDAAHIYWNRIGAIGRATVNGTGIDLNFISREPAEGFGSSANGVAADALTGPPPGPPPSNEFSFGKVKKNKRKGTAKLTVNVPGRGELDLAKTHRVKPGDETADAAGKEKLVVESRRRARKKLNADGKAKVNPKVTYAPDGGGPNTKRKKIKLVKR